VPFISENSNMKIALKILTLKKLGTLIVKNTKGDTTGIITDGQIRRVGQKNQNLHSLKVKEVMTKNPFTVNKDILAQKALAIMNEKKITSLCVNSSNKKNRTIGIIHIHSILEANIH
jgi:arabinose-5-phosphate isomerase